MKILAFVDLHGSRMALKQIKKKAEDVDIIACCGDLTIFSGKQAKLIKELDKIGKKVLMLHGNHELLSELKYDCNNTKNIKFFHKKIHREKGCLFIGYGGGGFALKDKAFDEWIKKINIRKDEKVILLLHGPPYGTKMDELSKNNYCGNKSYTAWIKAKQPKLVVCGHIHENFDRIDKIGKSLLANPGPSGKIFEV